ncbi:MAG TPA: hypothetical protein VMF51_02360 [Nocardioides sp.]|uniref:hypothetical protein n=1 Tax=Nocardioides sp. TaxID=35761 RepID=UPI002B861109|nr:hypothetical protein [Nocardioides sp.]HTW13939.1 hypothetical protein [Nocardioides sp.]
MTRFWQRLCVTVSSFAATTTLVAVAAPVAADPVAVAGPAVWVSARAEFDTTVERTVRFTLDATTGPETPEAEIASYDVRVARTPMSSSRRAAWRYPARLQIHEVRAGGGDGERRQLRLGVARGRVLCVSARATDTLGNVGAWSNDSCVTRFLHERRLIHHGDVRRVRDDRYWGGAGARIGGGGSLVLRSVPQGSRVVVLWAEERDWATSGTGTVTGVGDRGPRRLCSGPFGGWSEKNPDYRRRDRCSKRQGRHGPVRVHARWDPPTAPVQGLAIVPAWVR